MNDRLSIRIAITVGVLALLGAGLVSFVSYWRTHAVEVTSAQRTLSQLGATVERTAMIAAYLQNREIAEDAVLGLAKNEIVAAVSLTSLDGTFSVDHGHPASQSAQDAVRVALESPFTPGEQVGEMTIYPRQELINLNARSAALGNAVLLGGYTLLVALLVMAIIQWQFVPVLRQLASALHVINPGGPERLQLPSRHRDDEIGRLALDINRLLDLVQSKLDNERGLRLEMQDLEQRFRLIFERASVGIFLLDEDGCLVMANQAFRDILGRDGMSQIQGHQICLYQLFDDVERVIAMLEEATDHGQSTSADLSLANDASSTPRWVHCVLTRIRYNSDNHLAGRALVQGIVTDITERKQAERIIRFQAERDPLTNLANRRSAEAELNARLEQSRREGVCLAVCLIDLDQFKPINDTYGHDVGDKVLVAVAERIRDCVRRADLTARLGGDEFLVALLDVSCRSTIGSVARKLLESLARPIDLGDGLELRVGASLGISLSNEHGHDLQRLLSLADQAMYQVKRHGKNAFRVYSA
ncbi:MULTISPECIES: diguanylate cyclase domain-containing protein [Thiorhodovibrio]|uniref:diguanylate cyclase domain-containing protein n=1 Tax=Thiorhodovibrio TaxID=61593 RepID=UPI001912F048|nr:sensor domain-containing diguanylate cyclase [Thiorhodovibrio litoralis]